MTRWIALAALAAVGCAGVSDAPTSTPVNTVWLDESSPLYEAQQAWGMPLPFAPTVVLDAGTGPEVAELCGFPGGNAAACLMQGTETLLVAGDRPDRVESALRHELGHIYLTGTGRVHIEDARCHDDSDSVYGEFVMCAYSRTDAELQPEDFDFVLGRP